MKLSMNFFKSSLFWAIALLMMSGAAWAQSDSTSTSNSGVTVEVEDEGVTVTSEADTTEITWRDRRYIIISDDSGKRIEFKEVGENDEKAEAEEDWDEDWDWEDDEDYDYENKVEKRGSTSDVGLAALDLGITNYYYDGAYGTNAITPELAVREFRPGSHVALHLLPTTVSLIGRGYVNLKTAITIDWSNYYFTNDVTLLDQGDALAFDTTGVSFEKNKLTSRYAQIPLLLNFNTDRGGDDGVSISVGGYAGLLWSAHTKQESAEEGTVKVKGDYFLNPYRYGLMARIDFKWFDFYMMYNLSEHFTSGQGPQTQTFMAGLNLVDF